MVRRPRRRGKLSVAAGGGPHRGQGRFRLPRRDPAAGAAQARTEHDPRAATVYRTIGSYLGYALAHYADFYELKHLLLLGRVSSGEGGSIILDTAREVLKQEFPELAIGFHIPDEQFKRHGQAVIAATLPELAK